MITNSKILVLVAHPDDMEIGMGQYLLHLLDPKFQNLVDLWVVTDGCLGGNPTTRWNEQMKVESLIRGTYSNFRILRNQSTHRDCSLENSSQFSSELCTLVKEYDMALTHYPDDTHPDHRACARAMQSAGRHKSNILYFQSYTSVRWFPNMFYKFSRADLQSPIGKMAQLMCHQSQVEQYLSKYDDMLRQVETFARWNGYLCRAELAEGFVSQVLTLN